MGAMIKIQRISILFPFFILLVISFFPSFSAEDYYADLTIEVDVSGFVTIEGITNYPDLLIQDTALYTSKKQSYWLLNITKEEIFSDFVYTLMLPKGTSINYIKSSGFIRIEEQLGRLLVKGFGENESFFLLVQYQFEKFVGGTELTEGDVFFIVFLVLILILVVLLVYFYLKDKQRRGVSVIPKRDDVVSGLKGLNARQKAILRLLMEQKRPLTQTEIQKELNIPKAAVSRNIHGLEVKGLIEKEQIGMSNLIRLKNL